MRANSGKSTATVADLRAVVRRWVNFLHALDIIKTTAQSCLRSLAKHSPHWHQNVFPTGEAGGHKSKSGSLSFSPDWASAAAASVSSTVLYSASCRSFYGVTSSLCEAKQMGTKSSPDDYEEVLQLSEAIIRRVKWSYKSLLERRGLKMLRFFEKFGNHLFSISSRSIAVSMTSKGCVAAEFRRRCRRLSRRTARKPDVG